MNSSHSLIPSQNPDPFNSPNPNMPHSSSPTPSPASHSPRHTLIFALLSLLLAALSLFAFLNPSRISQEVLDLFPHTDERTLIEVYRQFASSKYVPVAIAGFDERASERLDSLLSEIERLKGVGKTTRVLDFSLQDFITHNDRFLLTPHTTPKISESSLNHQAQEIFAPLLAHAAPPNAIPPNATQLTTPHAVSQNLAQSPDQNLAITPANSLAQAPLQASSQSLLKAADYGYMAFVELESLDSQTLLEILHHFQALKADNPDLRYFSPDFMRVENLELILDEVNFLLGFASLAFALLYFIILRMPLLTLSTISTLVCANVVAILTLLALYPQVTIMSLSFGLGVSNIAIDYMLHHHFFGLYAARGGFNRPVFYGYATTMVGLGACLFVPFPLLSQLSLYAMISLSVAYVSFALIYPRLGFAPPRLFTNLAHLKRPLVPHWVFLLCALPCLLYATLNLKIDFDLSKLDYQNTPMLEEREFFATLGERGQSILLTAHDAPSLMHLVRDILSAQIPLEFRPIERAEGEAEWGEAYYYLAHIERDDLERLAQLFPRALRTLDSEPSESSPMDTSARIETRSLQSLLDSLALGIYKPMVVILLIALLLMTLTLFISTKEAFATSLSFMLLPLGVALCVVASHSEFNMMHLFALLILVVVSVDYGIYSVKEGDNLCTTHAILFSALTTGASFGILITSQTKALNSFGEVIFSGMMCILAMLILGKINAIMRD